MLRAYDVMTRAVAAVPPETPIRQVAGLMRDLKIGDVLVVENDKLRGIVTDRDLTLQVLTNGANSQSPVAPYMTTRVVTGQPDWTLDRVARVMGEHQVRRLPIVQGDNLVGIVSLGDVAVHAGRREPVAKSLRNISEVSRMRFQRAGFLSRLVGIALPLAIVGGVYVYLSSRSGRELRRQLEAGDLTDKARGAWDDALQSLQNIQRGLKLQDALEAKALTDRTHAAIQKGSALLGNPRAQKRAHKLAKQTRRQVRELQSLLAPKRTGWFG